jgi:hypothetical protein
MTHDDLVRRAIRWLKGTIGCGVVLSEHTAGREFPDAMGWRRRWSYVVECKVSRADFFADQKKPSRAGYDVRPALRCYYMTPLEMVKPEELPDGWGLLEVARAVRGNVRVIVEPKPENTWQDDRTAGQLLCEVERLYQEVRRYQAQGLRYKTFAEFHERPKQATLLAAAEPIAAPSE